MTIREIRAAGRVEARAAGDAAAPRMIGGYAATFGTTTDICGVFSEVLAPGCFAESLSRGDDVRALFNHDRNFVLGRVSSKTLTLAEDAKGLSFEVTPPNNGWANDLVVSVERGDLNECSFAFIARKEEWDETGDVPKRTVIQADLFDVSVVTIPAYPNTEASMRMLAEHRSHAELDTAAVARARLRMKHAQFTRGLHRA